jgi:hypothetical protein
MTDLTVKDLILALANDTLTTDDLTKLADATRARCDKQQQDLAQQIQEQRKLLAALEAEDAKLRAVSLNAPSKSLDPPPSKTYCSAATGGVTDGGYTLVTRRRPQPVTRFPDALNNDIDEREWNSMNLMQQRQIINLLKDTNRHENALTKNCTNCEGADGMCSYGTTCTWWHASDTFPHSPLRIGWGM